MTLRPPEQIAADLEEWAKEVGIVLPMKARMLRESAEALRRYGQWMADSETERVVAEAACREVIAIVEATISTVSTTATGTRERILAAARKGIEE